jgi:hypothetical protein
MQGNLHVRFGEGDEETFHREVEERFIPTLHLHQTSDVGTTYKRALKRFHLFRDEFIPRCFTTFALIDAVPKSPNITHQLQRFRCVSRVTLIRS